MQGNALILLVDDFSLLRRVRTHAWKFTPQSAYHHPVMIQDANTFTIWYHILFYYLF